MKVLNIFGLWLCAMVISSSCYAQRNDLLLTNSQSIADNPYEGIERSPFYFEHWQKGKIYPKSEEEPIEEVLLNYNGYTKNFEIKKGSRYIVLDEQWYKKVEITQENYLITFELGILSKYNNRFARALFTGTSFRVVQDFHVSLTTREKQVYGKVNEVQSFNAHRNYYFLKDGKSKPLKLKKKSILSFFPTHKKGLESYAKKHRLQWNKERDLVDLFTYYEELVNTVSLSSTGKE